MPAGYDLVLTDDSAFSDVFAKYNIGLFLARNTRPMRQFGEAYMARLVQEPRTPDQEFVNKLLRHAGPAMGLRMHVLDPALFTNGMRFYQKRERHPLNMSAIALLIYFAYWVLRLTIKDVDAKARITAVYNLFAFACLMILVMVIPRLTDSLHPGNGGNPALGGEDLDNTLRSVFYPVIIGYTLIGLWMAQLYYRYSSIKDKFESEEF